MKDKVNDSLQESVNLALEAMRLEAGDKFSLSKVNLAELERRTGISRAKLRRLKSNGFVVAPHANTGRNVERTVLTGYTGLLDSLLSQGVSNSSVCFERIQEAGYTGGLSTVKAYIHSHKHLLPAKRQVVAPQGNRGRRFSTAPGESYQMDWGFVNVADHSGGMFTVACFVMVCHCCGLRYAEFFPNAKQENLFIGMIRGFKYMGIPEYVLTDNMKSVVLRRNSEGEPIWHADYEAFMRSLDFKTKLCKPRHPYTKGKVERLVRFVKENFLEGRVFLNITDMNRQAREWCDKQNSIYHRAVNGVSLDIHRQECASRLKPLEDNPEIRQYLCPLRKISFDGFVNYEGRRFGVPYYYTRKQVRILRSDNKLYIYSDGLGQLLLEHDVTWSKHDSYCKDQYASNAQPEERPTAPVAVQTAFAQPPDANDSFAKFDFSKGVHWDE